MGSSRFPGKPMMNILEKPMIRWVYDAALNAKSVDRAIVTTPDREISDYCAAENIPCLITSKDHDRCLDRVHESYQMLSDKCSKDIIVCMQGDEPLVCEQMIDAQVAFHSKNYSDFVVSGLPINSLQFKDPNIVKIVYDDNFTTIYTSRSPVPYGFSETEPPVRIFGLFTMSPKGLATFNSLPVSRLELIESCDTNRILGTELKQKVFIHYSAPTQQSVDTPEDLVRAETLAKSRIYSS